MVKPTYTIAMAAVLVVAAFAGIALMGDDADGASEGEFNVTYSINGSTIVKETSDGKFTFEAATDVLSGYTAPTGYTFAGWKDVNSSTVYQVGPDTEYTFISDVTVEPYLSVSGVIVNFVYEDATYTIAKGETSYDVTADDIKAFAAEAGLTYTEGDDLLDMLSLKGAEFMGFAVKGSEDYITDLAGLGLDAAGEVTYTAVFETVYSVSFYFDETAKLTSVDSNRITESDLSALPDAPTLANHTFQGWVDAEGKTVFTYDALNETYVMAKGYVFDKDTSLYADFKANMMYVTFMVNGVQFGAISEVSYGNTVNAPALPAGYAYWAIQTKAPIYGEDGVTIVEPAEYAEFDFKTIISENLVLYAIPTDEVPSDVFTVTFVVDGKTIATYDSNSVTLPDTPVKEGYQFMGWTINNAVIADPVNYEFTADTQFIALFQAIDVTTYTVTIQMASGTTQNIEVAEGEVPELPALAEGKVWALGDEIFNPETAIATDIVLKEVDEYYTVSFAVNGTAYDAYAQEVKYGEKASAPAQFVFPDGYSGWDFNFDTVITSDVTVNAALIPAPAEEPAFYETTTGQVAIVIVVFALLFFGYAVYSNMGGIRDKLFGYTISKKEKKE